MKRVMLFLQFNLLILSCSSLNLEIKSEPEEASVFVKNGQRLRKLGVTPLQVNENDLGRGENFHLLIQKEGHQSEHLVLEKRTLKTDASIFTSLLKSVSDDQKVAEDGTQNIKDQQRSLATIQAQLIQNDFQQAEIMARDFLIKYPYSSVGWSLLGNAFLLQNRNGEALKAYKRSLEYDAQNEDTSKIIQFLSDSPSQRSQ